MKLIYKEKKGNKRTIHFCGIKFTYNKKRRKAEFFKIYETIPLLEKSLKNSQTQDTTLLQSREKDVYYYLFENIFYDKNVINRIQKEIPKKNQLIIIYCQYGGRSRNAYMIMKRLGYTNIYNLYGGLDMI